MKLVHLILLMAATVRAESNQTHAFFAKVNDTLKPLHVHEETIFLYKTFVWGSKFPIATEFYYENGRARPTYAIKPTYIVVKFTAGFFRDTFNKGSILKLDNHSRVRNNFFYSCDMKGLSEIQVTRLDPPCFLVDIYFLPYNRTTNAPVEGSYNPPKDVEMIPHALFAESKNTLEPIYLKTIQNFFYAPVLRYGNSSAKPLEFWFQEDYAITKVEGKISIYLAFSGNNFTTDRYYGQPKLGLDKRMQLTRHRFFSCDSEFPERIIDLNPSAKMNCYEVDMYLLPINRTSGQPMEGSYIPKNDTVKFDNYPHVFFMKFNGTVEPISYRKRDDMWTGGNYGVFHHQKLSTKPVEFTLRNNIVHTRDKSISGYAGLVNHEFVFGGATVGVPFDFDKNMKIKDHIFFSCANIRNPAMRDIVYDISHRDKCFEIDIYLLHYNRTSGGPIEGSYNSETDSTIHSNTDVLNNYKPEYPILPPDFPYVFFSSFRWKLVPLSTISSYDDNATTLFSELESDEAPVEFFLKDGVAYTDINSTRKYAGIYSYFLGFGDFVTEHKFEFEGQMRIRNSRFFFRCKHSGMSRHLIVSPIFHGAGCQKLKIHLLPYNRTSRGPVECRHMPQARANKSISKVSSCVLSTEPRILYEYRGSDSD